MYIIYIYMIIYVQFGEVWKSAKSAAVDFIHRFSPFQDQETKPKKKRAPFALRTSVQKYIEIYRNQKSLQVGHCRFMIFKASLSVSPSDFSFLAAA